MIPGTLTLRCPYCGYVRIHEARPDPFLEHDFIVWHGITHGLDLRDLATRWLCVRLGVAESADLDLP
jgi:hypothetical protein